MSAAGDVTARAVEVLLSHDAVTDMDCIWSCRCGWTTRPDHWPTRAEFAAHQAAMLAAAGLLATPDATARAKAEALREAAEEIETGYFHANIPAYPRAQTVTWLRARADRIDPEEKR